MLIRSYRNSDRDAVRRLAFETAEAGAPSTFPDARLQMDLLTRYYTDHEPKSIWIVEKEGRVIGYLTGCLDTANYLRWLKWRGNCLTTAHVIFRNFYRPAIWKWARARIRTLREGGAHRDEWIRSYPAHLHMNLSADARGQGIGAELLKNFFTQCEKAGVPGVHLATRGDNVSAQKFFERHGFSRVTMIHAYRAANGTIEPVPVLIMGRSL